MTTRLAVNGDLPTWAAVLACLLVLSSLTVLVVHELRRRERGGVAIVVSGVLALVALLLAVVRPVRIAARESVIGAKVIVLADNSRSMALPQDGKAPRSETQARALAELARKAKDSRLLVFGFGEGAPAPLAAKEGGGTGAPIAPRSDLGTALRALATSAEERPQAVVVVSDGRLDDPMEDAPSENLRALAGELKVPIHTIATTREGPPDASVRRVSAAGAAVAHVPLPLRVEVGCSGGLSCDELTVTARELREDGPPALLASGLSHLKDGKGTVDLSVTLERAGTRIIEIAITPPSGDTIPENDHRILTFVVARERVRVLHVAGRPTNDVRALRQWLKSDASVDVVAFFILRTQSDNPNAPQEDLSLIPFPVDELFTEHLPSFDAVVLQDFDAQPYGLEKHLPQLARYVRSGGGLIMVGGQNSF
ncbi:MAG TPA: vWA domain-containing protein, partial [Labilithrix sp.]|nr:vWA domain-containing protein [Labilithrix sp.]